MAHGKCKCRGEGIIETLKTINLKIYKLNCFRCRNGFLLNTEKNVQKGFEISTPKAFIIQKRSSTIAEDLNRMQARRKALDRNIREKVRKHETDKSFNNEKSFSHHKPSKICRQTRKLFRLSKNSRKTEYRFRIQKFCWYTGPS